MKENYFNLILVLIVLVIIPSKVYALSTPNKIVNHDDIASVSSYIADANVRNALSNQKWLFTHASVGANMVSGMVALKNGDSRYILGINNVSSTSTGVTTSNGNIYEINRGNPGITTKLSYFDSAFSTYGWANKVNIAMNKYCYIDIRDLSGSITVDDMPTYANQYLSSMQNLESAYPGVTFVYMTVPTTNAQSLGTARIYAFNQLVRNYASSSNKYLLDIADIESHDPSGVHQIGNYNGDTVEMLYASYTSDGGHINTTLGQQRGALGWYAMAISIAYNKNQVTVPTTPVIVPPTPAPSISVTGITVNPTTMDLVSGQTKSVTSTIYPTNATNKSVTWTSSDNSIATVNKGVVTAIRVGKVTITATTTDGNKKATVGVTVKPINVESVVIKNKDITKLVVDQTLKLETTVSPTNATNTEVIWASSNNNIAAVDNTGLVTALSKGIVTITVTTKDQNKTDKMDIEIAAKPVPLTKIKIKGLQSTSFVIGTKLQLSPILEPSNATDVLYVWESSDNEVATVNQEGIVSCIKKGVVTITLKTKDGKFFDKVELSIIEEKLSPVPIGKVGGIVILGSIATAIMMGIKIKRKSPYNC